MKTTDRKLSKPARQEMTELETKFSCNHLIDAYFSGMKNGFQGMTGIMSDILKNNEDKTAEQAVRIFNHIKEAGFHPIDTYIKAEAWNSFRILIIVPDSEWCDKSFLGILGWAGQFDADLSGNSYRLHTHFFGIENSDDLDWIALSSDGYIKFEAA